MLGGTFDPPHLGHLVLAAAARHALALDRVWFVPAGDPYRKADRAVTDPEARLRMTEAAIAPLSWAAARRDELDHRGPSYSWRTMEQLAAEGGADATGGEWWFILGFDALTDLPHWDQPARLVAASRLALALRPPLRLEFPRGVLEVAPGIENRVDALSMAPLDVSSTDLRRRVRHGLPTEVLLPEAVRAVIDAEGLYRRES